MRQPDLGFDYGQKESWGVGVVKTEVEAGKVTHFILRKRTLSDSSMMKVCL